MGPLGAQKWYPSQSGNGDSAKQKCYAVHETIHKKIKFDHALNKTTLSITN